MVLSLDKLVVSLLITKDLLLFFIVAVVNGLEGSLVYFILNPKLFCRS